MDITDTKDQTLTFSWNQDGCAHRFVISLGCEPHDYKHLWGWACERCWEQAFYADLNAACQANTE